MQIKRSRPNLSSDKDIETAFCGLLRLSYSPGSGGELRGERAFNDSPQSLSMLSLTIPMSSVCSWPCSGRRRPERPAAASDAYRALAKMAPLRQVFRKADVARRSPADGFTLWRSRNSRWGNRPFPTRADIGLRTAAAWDRSCRDAALLRNTRALPLAAESGRREPGTPWPPTATKRFRFHFGKERRVCSIPGDSTLRHRLEFCSS